MSGPELPPLSRCAFLLDLDGTLLDIAPTPEAVLVPPGLAAALLALRARCGDALAVVTGRPIAQIDALLPGVPYAVAGEHGAAARHAPDAAVETAALPSPPSDWVRQARHLAVTHPGARFEPKAHGFVLHYRAAPEHGPALQRALAAMIAPQAGVFALLAAKMAWEVRPAGTDKGVAVRGLMRLPPFAGRLPVFVGDDVTDEDGIAAARELGGVGLMVPEVFGDAAGVRAWVGALASK